ncbi:MAG: hypothetical protein ACLQVI_35130 [Polyangiaceae bacterium]
MQEKCATPRSRDLDALARRLGLAARDPDDGDPAVVLAWVERLIGSTPAHEVLVDGSSTAQ